MRRAKAKAYGWMTMGMLGAGCVAGCVSFPDIAQPSPSASASTAPQSFEVTAIGLTGNMTVVCDGVSQVVAGDGNFACNGNAADPNIFIAQAPSGEACSTVGLSIICQRIKSGGDMNTTASPTPTPTPTSAGGGSPVTPVNVTVSGVIPGATVSVAVNGNRQNSLGNGTYTFATAGAAGAAYAVTLPAAGPALSCAASPASGQLVSGGVAVRVTCKRAVKLMQTQAAVIALGQADLGTTTAPAGNSTLSQPHGVASSPLGDLIYISDTNNARVVSAAAPPTTGETFSILANPGGLYVGPRRISINAAGKMAVTDYSTNKITIYASPPNAQNQPSVVLGSGTPGVGPQAFNTPIAAFLLDNGMLVADRGNNRVLIYSAIPANSAASPSLVLGQTAMSNNAAGCTASTMNGPEDAWSDGTYVAVADSVNNRVLVWLSFPTSNADAADVVLGQASATSCTAGSNAGVTGAQMNIPAAVAGDSATLFVADGSNHRVLAYPMAGLQTGMAAAYALGQPDLTSNQPNQGGNTQSFTLYQPFAVQFWSTCLMVADASNNRVLLYQSQ